ncbi:uracil nucleotide/cysteinyl leukotriene receptor [Poeciliopsis prolifica]|uniref:uracil nucleotide/cysteinyl leukotriene receptor n=1 Tax=Poeciliopsis prolifica TaxID=188132 RepID=UPI002413A4A8|nr:uracil nucleotide/cysteinyl leukotriene receptor [Poeciliopsis prolifica]
MTHANTSTENETNRLPPWDIVLAVFYMLIFIIAVPGNSLALWAFCHQKSTSPSKVFLRNLAVADICYVLILPMRIVYHLSGSHWPFGDILCQLSGFLFYLNMYCSLYLMSFISLDRLIAVTLPLMSQVVRKPLYAHIGVTILWVIVIVSMIPTLFSQKTQNNSPNNCSMLYLEKTSPKALISTIVAFSIPFTTIVITSLVILLKLRNLKQHEERPVKDKAMKMIVLVVLNFMFAFVPYHICRVIYTQRPAGRLESLSLKRANQITSALSCISGVLDPVMYFFLNRVYRNTFLRLFFKTQNTSL